MIDNYLNIKSIDPIYWGKSGWIFLNSIAITYDPKYKENYKIFIQQLPYILPCKTCGENLLKNLHDIDHALESKQNFLIWLLNVRNEISTDHKRPIRTIEENINEIFSINNNYLLVWSSTIIIMVIVLFILLYLLKNVVNKGL